MDELQQFNMVKIESRLQTIRDFISLIMGNNDTYVGMNL